MDLVKERNNGEPKRRGFDAVPSWYRILDRFGAPTFVLFVVIGLFVWYVKAMRTDVKEYHNEFREDLHNMTTAVTNVTTAVTNGATAQSAKLESINNLLSAHLAGDHPVPRRHRTAAITAGATIGEVP